MGGCGAYGVVHVLLSQSSLFKRDRQALRPEQHVGRRSFFVKNAKSRKLGIQQQLPRRSRTYSQTARGLSLALVCLILSLQPSFASTADEVKVLVEQGRHEEAYRTGQRARGEAGHAVFDFYFGVAAINAGKASDGVLALERYLLNFPDNLVARLELARGYYLLGDDGRAIDEFEAILAGKSAADIARVVRVYLDALRARESRHKTNFSFSIELGAGNDSNVQSGVVDPKYSRNSLYACRVSAGLQQWRRQSGTRWYLWRCTVNSADGTPEKFRFLEGEISGSRNGANIFDAGKISGDGNIHWGRWGPAGDVTVSGNTFSPPTGVHFVYGTLTPPDVLSRPVCLLAWRAPHLTM